MSDHPWPEQFEKILRAHVPNLVDDIPLEPHTALPELGLDSLVTVSLLVGIEEFFDITIPDDELGAETFATPADLWAVVDRLR